MPKARKALCLLVPLVLSAAFGFGQAVGWQSPSPSPPEATALLRAICPTSIEPDHSTSTSLPVCKPCPEYTTVGRLQPQMALHQSFALRTVIHGSFTAPGVEEAVASFEGCEPHAEEFGGTFLLSKLHGSWAMVDYTPALITSACQTYHLGTGRDLLLCDGEDHHMAGASQRISLCDFSREASSRCQNAFGVLDTRVACGPSAVWGSIDKVELRDLNGDGMPDLILVIGVGQGAFLNPGGSCNADTSHAPVERQKLDFFFQQDTNNFLPAPDSQARAARLQALFKGAQEKALKAVSGGASP